MLPKEEYLELHSIFYDSFIGLPASQGTYLPYEPYVVRPETDQGPQWLIFSSMAQDFIVELLNEINQFMTDILKLEAWTKVKSQCSKEQDFDFIIEIYGPIATSTINKIYVAKQRIIYVSSMLLHQSKMLINSDYKEDQLDEKRIDINTLDKFNGQFSKVHDFIKAVREIDNDEFRKDTNNFRNAYQHRIPIRIGVGISSFITRIRDGKGNASYGLGGHQPLDVSAILPSLYKQHKLCLAAFSAFWELVGELLEVWASKKSILT